MAEIAKRLGRKALKDIARVAKPDTILAWYQRLVTQKFDGSKQRQYPGRPPVSSELEALVVRMARENSSWGYDRIVGAMGNLGHVLSDQTVKNILRRHGIPPAPKRSQITHLACEEGWSFIAEWTGVPLSHVLELVGVLPQAKFVVYFSIQPRWWNSFDMAEAERAVLREFGSR